MASGVSSQLVNIKPFDGTAFENWVYRVEKLLNRHGVWDKINSEPPKEEALLRLWKVDDAKAQDLIVQCIADCCLELVKKQTTAKGMLDVLKNTYVRTGTTSLVRIQRKLRSMNYDGNTQLNEFLMEYDRTINELKDNGGSIDDREYAVQLLSMMPKSYDNVATSLQILLGKEGEDGKETQLSPSFVKNMLLVEEEKLGSRIETTNEENGTAFSSYRRSSGSSSTYRNGNRNRERDVTSSGYQQNNGRRENGQLNSYVFNGRCHKCNGKGHMRRQCPTRFTDKTVNVATTEEEDDEIAFLSHRACELNFDVNNCLPNENSHCFAASDNLIDFCLDSGCSHHLVRSHFEQFIVNARPCDQKIGVAKADTSVSAVVTGDLPLVASNNLLVLLKNVYVCQDLTCNLLSVKLMTASGLKVSFNNKCADIFRNGQLIASAERRGNLYWLTLKIRFPPVANLTVSPALLHRRMGHSSLYPSGNGICEVCAKSKQTRKPFLDKVPTERKATRILEYVSSDVCGKISPPSHNSYNYFVTFIDHFSHFCIVYLLKEKSEVTECFSKYLNLVKNKFGRYPSFLRVDNGGEYTSAAFKKLCENSGVEIMYTIPRNPENNGVAERYNRTLVEMSRALLFDAEIGKEYWNHALLTSVYILNRLPSRTIEKGKTPVELWYGYPPDLSKIRVFGCICYAHVPAEDRKGKLDARSKKMRLLGFVHNGYRLLDIEKGRIVTARSVLFDEGNYVTTVELQENLESSDLTPDSIKSSPSSSPQSSPESSPLKSSDSSPEKSPSGSPVYRTPDQGIRRSARTRRPPDRLCDYDLFT